MALAARSRRSAKSGRPDQDWAPGYEVRGAPGSGLSPAHNVGRLYRESAEDQARRPATEVQDGDGGRLGSAAGLTPAGHPERAIRAAEASATPNGHLTNVESIVSGLREGTAASRRRIAGEVVADGARHLAAAEAEPGSRRGAVQGADNGRVAGLTAMPLLRAAAAEGLEVHAYRGAPPPRPGEQARTAAGGYDPLTWRAQREAPAIGRSKAPGEFRSHTLDGTTIGDHPDRVFGFVAEVPGSIHGAPTGPKGLRSGDWSDSAGLTDEVGGFGSDMSA